MSMDAQKQFALRWIDDNAKRFSDLDIEIWNYAESAWREYKSADAYVEFLRDEGFEVEEGSGEMPTAFVATYGSGGPVLGSYAEYDAVPGNSQRPVPYKAVREGLHPWTAGHTDPHSMLGVANLIGVVAAKRTMEKYGLPGTLKFFGEPAEKVCGSKPIHAAKGYYDGFDAFVAYHPWGTNTAEWDTMFGAYWSAVFTFEAEEPETWTQGMDMAAYGPATRVTAPGSLEALFLMYTNTKYTSHAMFPRSGNWTLNEFVLAAGDATADNLPSRFSQIQYAWRASSLEIQEQIYRVIENNARHAAAVAGCKASVRWVTKTRVGLPNHAMAQLAYDNLKVVGGPQYSEEALEFAREIQRNLGLEPMDDPFPPELYEVVHPSDYEQQVRQALPPWQTHTGADDYVEYTWHAPTVRLLTARPRLKPPTPGYVYPAWANNAMGGRPELVDPGMFIAGKVVAGTLLDLICKPEKLQEAKAEFQQRTGGGVGGTGWVPPLLPADIDPPTDLRWPEYIQTVRGEEWWIPTPRSGSGAGDPI